MSAELVSLGELFSRACVVLGQPPPGPTLVRALNDPDPNSALRELIGSNNETRGLERGLHVDRRCAAGRSSCCCSSSTAGNIPKANLGAVDDDEEEGVRQVCALVESVAVAHTQAGGCSSSQLSTAHAALGRALDELACQRRQQAAMTTEPPDHVLNELVAQRLATPGRPLSPAESRDVLLRCIDHGRVSATRAQARQLVVIVGNTGAGKSALVNLLHGCRFELAADGRVEVARDSRLAELMPIGHRNVSATFAPQIEPSSALGDGYAFADCPGFLDNRGFEVNVANGENVRRAVAAAQSAVLVVLINYFSLRADRGKGVRDLLSILVGLFGSAERVAAHAPSMLLAVSHAPVAHPETGRALTLDLSLTLTLTHCSSRDRPGLEPIALNERK